MKFYNDFHPNHGQYRKEGDAGFTSYNARIFIRIIMRRVRENNWSDFPFLQDENLKSFKVFSTIMKIIARCLSYH